MAEEKTSKVFVRLVKGFPTGVTHRRSGIALTAGPAPVEADVTKEQLDALHADPSIEFVGKADSEKIAAANETVETTEGTQTTGRNYDTGEATKSTKADLEK